MLKNHSNKFKTQVVAVLFTVAMMFGMLPTTAFAAEPTYNVNDIAVINTIIDTNGLALPKADPADGSAVPAEWDGIIGWTISVTNRRVNGIRADDKGLNGTLDLSYLSELLTLSVQNDSLTGLNITGCTKLYSISAANNNLTALDVSTNTLLDFVNIPGNDMPAEPVGAGVTGTENLVYFKGWNRRDYDPVETHFYYSPQRGEAAPTPNPAPEPAPAPAPEPAPAPPAVVDLAPPSGGEGGTAVPANTNLVAVAASGGDVTTMSQLVAAQGIAGDLIQTLDIKLYDAAGNPISGACTIRVNIPGLTANDKVTILHRFDNGSTERITATARNGYCTFRVSTFSLFGVVVNKGAGSGGTTPNSPQTGVYN